MLTASQATKIDSKSDLTELASQLAKDLGFSIDNLARWEAKRDRFIDDDLAAIQSTLPVVNENIIEEVNEHLSAETQTDSIEKLGNEASERLGEGEEKILLMISEAEGINNVQLVHLSGLNSTRVGYYLDELRELNYVSTGFGYNVIQYYLSSKGREYLVKNNLK